MGDFNATHVAFQWKPPSANAGVTISGWQIWVSGVPLSAANDCITVHDSGIDGQFLQLMVKGLAPVREYTVGVAALVNSIPVTSSKSIDQGFRTKEMDGSEQDMPYVPFNPKVVCSTVAIETPVRSTSSK